MDAYAEAGWEVVSRSQNGDPNTCGERLYDWLDRYALHARHTLTERSEEDGKLEPTEWGTVYAKTVAGIKRASADIPLSSLDYPTVEGIVIYFANRPMSQKTGKSISVKFAKAHIKAFKRFIQWLPKNTKWRKPEDWQDAFNHRPKVSREEKSEKPIGIVKAYKVDQLAMIYRYATPTNAVSFCWPSTVALAQLRFRSFASGS